MGMNVNLTPHLEELVRRKIASGLYSSASEVVREALRLMEEQDRLREAKLDQLRRDIRAGKESGPSVQWDAKRVKRRASPLHSPPASSLALGETAASRSTSIVGQLVDHRYDPVEPLPNCASTSRAECRTRTTSIPSSSGS
jgi:antitoxin ParD1/3/4